MLSVILPLKRIKAEDDFFHILDSSQIILFFYNKLKTSSTQVFVKSPHLKSTVVMGVKIDMKLIEGETGFYINDAKVADV